MATEEREVMGYTATGLNPHYRPAINRWRTVELKLPEGMMAGVILDSAVTGSLCIVVQSGDTWPDNVELASGQVPHPITKDRRFFAVTAGDRGDPVGHEFEPDAEEPATCRRCRAEK